MFYIEKNDKPNWIEKKLNLIKIQDNTILLPITKEIGNKKIEILAQKTRKSIQK